VRPGAGRDAYHSDIYDITLPCEFATDVLSTGRTRPKKAPETLRVPELGGHPRFRLLPLVAAGEVLRHLVTHGPEDGHERAVVADAIAGHQHGLLSHPDLPFAIRS
jgi:hypothetical protein